MRNRMMELKKEGNALYATKNGMRKLVIKRIKNESGADFADFCDVAIASFGKFIATTLDAEEREDLVAAANAFRCPEHL